MIVICHMMIIIKEKLNKIEKKLKKKLNKNLSIICLIILVYLNILKLYHKMETAFVPYMLYRYKVRNDEHCPICRQPILSFHNSITDAYDEAEKCIKDRDEDEDALIPNLLNGDSIWIDEWVRRRNGDLYQIVKIIPDKKYNSVEWEDDVESINFNCCKQNHQNKFMLLHQRIRITENCPFKNIYQFSFYQSYESAQNALLKNMSKKKYNKFIQLDKLSFSVDKHKNDKLIGLDYFQIIELQPNLKINLSECCPTLEKFEW